jgi:hypothetical protein
LSNQNPFEGKDNREVVGFIFVESTDEKYGFLVINVETEGKGTFPQVFPGTNRTVGALFVIKEHNTQFSNVVLFVEPLIIGFILGPIKLQRTFILFSETIIVHHQFFINRAKLIGIHIAGLLLYDNIIKESFFDIISR